MDIEYKIIHYIDSIQNVDYLADIITSLPNSDLDHFIADLLHSESDEIISLICLFIRDVMTFGYSNPECEKFKEKYPKSKILKKIEDLVFSNNHFIRSQAIYTLGKTCNYGSIHILNKAFKTFRDTDPLLLPILISEMGWLGIGSFSERIESIISSELYTTRWVALSILPDINREAAELENEIFKAKKNWINKLREDPNDLIRLEAEYEYQLLEFQRSLSNLSRGDIKRKKKNLEQEFKPVVSFQSAALIFTRNLHISGISQYSVSDFQSFIENDLHTIEHQS
jgi:hypothetical protein